MPRLPPNLLVVMADDMSADFVAAYGESELDLRTPVIDGLAREGVLFRNAWGYPACTPARAAFQFSRHARRTGVGANHEPRREDGPFAVDPTEVSIPEMLAASPYGYETAYFGKWHIPDTVDPASPRTEGWQFFQGTEANLISAGERNAYFNWRKQENDGTLHGQRGYVTSDVVDDALRHVPAMSEPWVTVVAFNAPHAPYHVPPRDLFTYPLAAVLPPGSPLGIIEPPVWTTLAMIEAMDTELGRLLDGLGPDLRGRTNVIFLGDNGTRSLVRQGPGKRSLLDAGIRVPMIVQGPWVGQRGVESAALVSVVDVLATLAEDAEVDPATLAHPIDGRSLLDALADPAAPVHPTLWSERTDPIGPGPYRVDEVALRDDRYKLIRDRVHGRDAFFEYVPGRLGEGPDLLRAGLTAAQQTAYDALSAELDHRIAAYEADLPYP